MELRRIPVHSSLHRANLVMGAERELALGSALAALLVGIGGMSLVSAGAAIVFWFCAIWALRRMARADPMMSKVWLRHVRQQHKRPVKLYRHAPCLLFGSDRANLNRGLLRLLHCRDRLLHWLRRLIVSLHIRQVRVRWIGVSHIFYTSLCFKSGKPARRRVPRRWDVLPFSPVFIISLLPLF